ncbi:MAG: ATPase [Propionivibrio sp.]|nr:ATPase [Propionivibrio sp.]
MRQNCTLIPQKNDHGDVELVCITLSDFTDTAMYQNRLNDLIDQLKNEKAAQLKLIKKLEDTQGQLLQSEKMASVGQLAAGVAHEINNPIGFINSNLGSLKEQVEGLLSVIAAYEQTESALAAQPALLESVRRAKEQADLDYLRDDIRSLIDESREGVVRVKQIVDNLKDFSRVDLSEWHFANLEQGLESTLNIVWNEIKYKAEVVKEYARLPEIECIASQINQVFMNLLVNAAYAIEERGTITLRTGCDTSEVWVEVEDTGAGIRPEHLARIFEPFFTTKPIGKGTGLGLSLAYGIVQRHHGRLDVRSKVGRGTTFRMSLPITRKTDQTDAV